MKPQTKIPQWAQVGAAIIYNDGRAGHTDARAVVLSVSDFAAVVQFEDRADTTTIRFNDKAWYDFIRQA